MTSATARVTAVVITYGHAGEIADCLDALLAQQVEGGLQVVVVDNCSPDDTLSVLQSYGSAIELLAQRVNTGYAAATDAGAARAGGDFLLLLNPDCVLDDGAVQVLVDHLDRTPGVGAASALLRYPDGRPQAFCRRDLTLAMVLWDLTELGRRWDKRFRDDAGRRHRRYGEVFDGGPPADVLEVDCPAAACVLMWRAPFRSEVMSPELPLFFNDGDLYGRMRAKSYVVHLVPGATAVHGYSTSLQRLHAARKRAEFVASLRVWARRWWPLRRRVLLWLLLVLDVLTSLLLSLRGGRATLSRQHAKGTLGGLGLPGGAAPWLTTFPGLPVRLRRTALSCREAAWTWLTAARRRSRRRAVVRRWRREARLSRTRLTLEVDRSADLARDVRLELRGRSRAVVRIGPRCLLQSGVVLRVWGGELVLESGVHARYGACLTAKGRLLLQRRVVVSRGVNVHADGELVIGFGASLAEGVTVLDTAHVVGTLLPVYDHPVALRPVSLGPGCFIGANAVVAGGVTIGPRAVVGAGSVVTRDVAEGAVVVGQPARPR